MKPTLAGSMAVLHTWCGVLFAWILIPVFITGALSVFWMEIGNWGTPQLFAHARPDRAVIIDNGLAYLARTHADSGIWRLVLPNDRDRALGVAWEDDKGETLKRSLDPATGQEVRDSEGGWLFVHFHYRFHVMGKNRLALWLVGLASVAMLVSCVSGVIIHRRIFRDFFLLRWRSSRQRAWTDVHNVLGVLPLPFHVMIVLTGLAISATAYMPAGVEALKGGASPKPSSSAEERPHGGGPAAGHVSIAQLVAQIDQENAPAIVQYFYIDAPGRPKETLRFSLQRDDRVSTQFRQLVYSGTTGELVRAVKRPPVAATQFFLRSWHFAQFGGLPMRWLFFLAGLAGAGTMAAGVILFTVKRQARVLSPAMAGLLKVAGRINVLAIAGPVLATLIYMWAMRLLPARLADRPDAELHAFYWALLASAVHALVRPPRSGWTEQLTAIAALSLALPLLSLVDPGMSLPLSLVTGNWSFAGVELSSLALGVLAAWMALRLGQGAAIAPSRPSPTAVR